MKDATSEALKRAGKVVSGSRSLNYQRILRHDEEEVAKLNHLLKQLGGTHTKIDEPLENYASHPEQGRPTERDDSVKAERCKKMIVRLEQEGFGDRLGKVYNSFAKGRSVEFDRLPHRRGIPPFDLAIAPDFSPVAGMHGIFIAGDTIFSYNLPADTPPTGNWELLKKKSFTTEDEMAEMVTLIAAGFDLP